MKRSWQAKVVFVVLILSVELLFAESRDRFRDYFSQFQPKQYSNEFSPTIGQEIEMILPSDRTRLDIARAVAEMLRGDEKISSVSTSTLGSSSGEVTYRSSSGKERVIAFKQDLSVDRDKSLELVSPIIASEKEYDRFLRVVDKVKGYSPVVPVDKAGLHAHIGFKSAHAAELAVLTTLWGGIESKMLEHFHVNENRRRWANPLPSFLTDVSRSIVGSVLRENGTEHSWRNADSPKYRTLNLLPLDSKSTVEFRFPNATLNPTVLKGMSDFFRSLVRAIRTQKPELVTLLTTKDLAQIGLKELSTAIGATYFSEKFDEISRITREENPHNYSSTSASSYSAVSSPSSSGRPCPDCGSYSCRNAMRRISSNY